MESLYGPIIGANERRIGNYAITSFYIKMLNEEYTEPGMIDNYRSLKKYYSILMFQNRLSIKEVLIL